MTRTQKKTIQAVQQRLLKKHLAENKLPVATIWITDKGTAHPEVHYTLMDEAGVPQSRLVCLWAVQAVYQELSDEIKSMYTEPETQE